MTYRQHKDIAAVLAEGRAKAGAQARLKELARQQAEEAVHDLIAYLGERSVKATLTVQSYGAALQLETEAGCWPIGKAKHWRFFRVADSIEEVTPGAVERLASTPGFAACVDEYVTWRLKHERGEEAKRRFVMRSAPFITAAMVSALVLGYSPAAVSFLSVCALIFLFGGGAIAADNATKGSEE